MIEGVQLVSAVWRPYSGGTSATSVSSITYTGCLMGDGCGEYVGLRVRLEGGCRTFEEEARDAASSKLLDGWSRLFTSSGNWFCVEPESLRGAIEGSGSGCNLDCRFGRKGSRGTSVSSLVVMGVNGAVESDIVGIEGEYEYGRVTWGASVTDDAVLIFDICWYGAWCPATDGKGEIVEGTSVGALYGFVEEKYWLAK